MAVKTNMQKLIGRLHKSVLSRLVLWLPETNRFASESDPDFANTAHMNDTHGATQFRIQGPPSAILMFVNLYASNILKPGP